MNTWSKSAQYYDFILGKKRFEKSAAFIAKILKKQGIKTVLELGCGTGLYLAPLRKQFSIEGLDISPQMLKQAKASQVPLYQQDMTTFKLKKRYDAILCLNSSLLMLPDARSIRKTIMQCKKHLIPGGLLILDLPNHEKEISEATGTEKSSYKTPKGVLQLTNHAYQRGKFWIEEWDGAIGSKRFHEEFREFIYSPGSLERTLKAQGFEILSLYGSRTGGRFMNDSYRRLYVCRLKKKKKSRTAS